MLLLLFLFLLLRLIQANYVVRLHEVQTSYYWFLNQTAYDGWRKYVFSTQIDFINSFIKQRPPHDFIEVKKISNNVDNENRAKYGVAVIELQHYTNGNPLLLKFANFSSAAFDGKDDLFMAGIVNDREASSYGVELKNIRWDMFTFKQECFICERKISKNFAILLFDMASASSEELHVFKNIETDSFKPMLNAAVTAFLKKSTVDAFVIIENHSILQDEKLNWIKEIMTKLNIESNLYSLNFQQSMSRVDNKWMSTNPTPSKPNEINLSILSPFYDFIFSIFYFLFPSYNTEIPNITDEPVTSFQQSHTMEKKLPFNCRPMILSSIRLFESNGFQTNIVSVKIETGNICNENYAKEFADNDDGVYGVMLLMFKNASIFVNNYYEFKAKEKFRENIFVNLTVDINYHIYDNKMAFLLIELGNDSNENIKTLLKPGQFKAIEKLVQPLIIDYYVENLVYESLFKTNSVIASVMDRLGLNRSPTCEFTQSILNENNPLKRRSKIRNKCETQESSGQ